MHYQIISINFSFFFLLINGCIKSSRSRIIGKFLIWSYNKMYRKFELGSIKYLVLELKSNQARNKLDLSNFFLIPWVQAWQFNDKIHGNTTQRINNYNDTPLRNILDDRVWRVSTKRSNVQFFPALPSKLWECHTELVQCGLLD